jgi:hypothetical protein
LEILVSRSSDEHQTSLKWDSSSHPVAPESRVSHTLHLKYIEGAFEVPFASSAVHSQEKLPGKQAVLPDIQDLKVLNKSVLPY